MESQRARVAGFTRQARLAGVESLEVINCLAMALASPTRVSGGSYGVGHFGIAAMARERARLGFTAAFADSDMGALGAMKALHEARIAMPAEVSVIGFDDLPEAHCFHPALTTIRQDLSGWFHAALRIIESRIAGDTGPAQRIRVRPELVVRESTGPCPTAVH